MLQLSSKLLRLIHPCWPPIVAACWPLVVCVLMAIGASDGLGAEPDRRGIEFFEKRIRPVLVKHCYECHSSKSDELGGELLLDTRDGTRQGGASGHAVVPGNLTDSLLISAIRFEDLEMPPEKQLPDPVIADFEKWIKMGAPDSRDGESITETGIDFAAAADFWSFRPIQDPEVPPVRDAGWPVSDIDRFVQSQWESTGLTPVGDAEPRVLLRRVYFDLTGLPPTPQRLAEFVAEPSSAAFELVVDRLLDSPQFGERWGRHWLDVVRYGESTGMERNFTYPYAWRYRDYVIASFNQDKPFDRFIVEQVAGDQLPTESRTKRDEQLIATGLLAIGTKSLNETNREKFAMDVVDEQIDVTSRAFMALTVSCARCHDHKFDPIPNEEYYSLAGIFRSTEVFYGTAKVNGNRHVGRLLALGPKVRPVTPAGPNNKKKKQNQNKKRLANRLKAAKGRVARLKKLVAKSQPPALEAARRQLATAETQLKRLQAQRRRQARTAKAKATSNGKAKGKPRRAQPPAVLAMAVQDVARPSDTEVRIRGEATQRGERVPRGFLTIVTPGESPKIDPATSGRLQFAHWLTNPSHPLTARVAVNRIWMHLFGRGIVPSVNNFGFNGARPTHPQLLDHLATRFVQRDWSVKQLVRAIVLSRVYQLSSQSHPQAERLDPDNLLLWKMNHRRLEAEAIRDAMLLASGQLDLLPAQGSTVQAVGDGDVGRGAIADRLAVRSRKRSVYLPIVRGLVPEMLRTFDFPDPSMVFGQRDVTTVPSQSLFMMNSDFVIQQSQHFARRLLAVELEDDQRVELAYRLALSRSPSPEELMAAERFLVAACEQQDSEPSAQVEPWTAFCQTLYGCSEFRYLE